ncbi:DUF3298 and DUF4163 domain-containing protein [Salirhabdus sp. Marseille-P4669]|uniref:DUF3298 and DUF4163 domain-containing protein n=1 Tax=Salirhabdus sp. Marseille-P4669 TaxID=2042310 RepID=UPI000C79A770|nr:DUF3298 and DUF4163 domain-containing protein [Salirhabdus sp. Marseille-P4669]
MRLLQTTCSVYLLFLLSFMIGIGAISAEEIAKEKVDEDTFVSVSYDEFKEKKPEYEIKMETPIFRNVKDTFFELKLNHALKKEATDKRATFITKAMAAAKELKDKGEEIRPHQLFVEGQLKMNGEMVSHYSETYLFQGGAHGVTEVQTLNFLNGNKVKLLTFQDLFQEETAYQEFINKKIKQEIQKRIDEDIAYFEGEEGFQTVKDDQTFYFDDGNLVILFDQYEIAPGYVGIPAFQISMEELKEYIKPNIYDAVKNSKSLSNEEQIGEKKE